MEKKILAEFFVGISHTPEGKSWFPTHSFEEIKKHRFDAFEGIKSKFIEERKIKILTTTEIDLFHLRQHFLKNEIKEIERLSNHSELSSSDHIELNKYREWVEVELQKDLGKIPVKNFKLRPGITPEIVSDYYHWLIRKKYTSCTLKEFQEIFSNDPLPDTWKPIVWEKCKTSLAATVLSLLDVPKTMGILSEYFVDASGNHIYPLLKAPERKLKPHLYPFSVK